MIDLSEIKKAYLSDKSIDEINKMYKEGLLEVTEEQQLEIWKQVCGFANFEMVDYLISLGWRTMGIEDSYGNNLLHLMAQPLYENSYLIAEGQIYKTTKLLLANKVSPIKKNLYKLSALMIGAKSGYFEMLNAYQEAGLKIDWVDDEGNTLLHFAARSSAQFASDVASVQKEYQVNYQEPRVKPYSIIGAKRKADLELQYKLKQTRLDHFIKFISQCIVFGMNSSQKNNIGDTAIDIAIRFKSKLAGIVLKGIDLSDPHTAPLYINTGGQDIFQACINKDLQAIDALIKLGVNLNEEYDKIGDTYHGMLPVTIAVILHDHESIDLLLKNGADPNLKDSKSWHPFRYLYIPISNINTDLSQFENKTFQKILKSFITAGFDINSLMDDDGNTLLTLSANNANIQLHNSNTIAKTMIQEAVYLNADVNKTNVDGVTALMYLCLADTQRAENEIITLLEQGGLTNLKDKNGRTALMYASTNSEKSTAKMYCELLEQFGDICIDAIDNSEKSALDYAIEKDNENLVAWLLEKQ